MRRSGLVAAALVAALMLLTVPAQAKGEGGVITITPKGPWTGGTLSGSGSGLSSPSGLLVPIVITGERGAFWLGDSGFGERAKGHRPAGRLGLAYDARVSFLCDGRHRGTFHQVIYPYAPQGPEVFLPAGQHFCSMSLSPGWWNAPSEFFEYLVSYGLPRHQPGTAVAVKAHPGLPAAKPAAQPAQAAQHRSAPTHTWLIVLGVVALLALLTGGAAIQRRRVRVAA